MLIAFVLVVVSLMLLPFIIKCMFKFFMLVLVCTALFYGYAYVHAHSVSTMHEPHNHSHSNTHHSQIKKVVDEDIDYGYKSNDDGSDASDMYIDANGNYTIPDFD